MSKKGGRGGGHLQSKKNHCKFMQVSAYLRAFAKKARCNFQKGTGGGGRGGDQGRLDFFQKNIQIWGDGHPLPGKQTSNKKCRKQKIRISISVLQILLKWCPIFKKIIAKESIQSRSYLASSICKQALRVLVENKLFLGIRYQ